MGDIMKELREKSRKRKLLLAQTLGVSNPDELRHVLGTSIEAPKIRHTSPTKTTSPIPTNYSLITTTTNTETTTTLLSTSLTSSTMPTTTNSTNTNINSNKSELRLTNEDKSTPPLTQPVPLSETSATPQNKDTALPPPEDGGLVYRDSSTFLKGTQSSNPHNDYCQHFVDTGQRPQNFIRDVGLADRFEEYPKLRELIKLKDELIEQTANPPMYLKCDLTPCDVKNLNTKFDVILIEPPLEEYQRTMGGGAINASTKFWPWEQIMNLDIGEVAAQRSFVFLWCGSSEGLDMGRVCLRKWGFRRCEDICWIRTNIKNPGHSKSLDPKAVFQRTKEHCLMGIKGTVRRSTDGDFIHANVDIDLIISEENEYGSLEKPVEIFHIIEHFCLGRRRLHVFGRDSTIRPGWLTIGPELTNSNYYGELYASYFDNSNITTGCTERIEALRPKSPPPKGKGIAAGRGRGGSFQRGRGRGR